MVDPIRLGQLARVASLRRDRSEIALADAGRASEATEQALVQATAAEARAARRSAEAERLFVADPASPQAQLWRQVQVDRAAEARDAAAASAARRDEALAVRDAARADLLRADVRLDRTSDLHARALRGYARLRDEREAEDRPHAPTRIA